MSERSAPLPLSGALRQAVMMEVARRCGFRIVPCDYLLNNPGKLTADSFRLVNTTDREAVLQVTRREDVGARRCFHPLANAFSRYRGRFGSGDASVGEDVVARMLALPMCAGLALDGVGFVCEIVRGHVR